MNRLSRYEVVEHNGTEHTGVFHIYKVEDGCFKFIRCVHDYQDDENPEYMGSFWIKEELVATVKLREGVGIGSADDNQ